MPRALLGLQGKDLSSGTYGLSVYYPIKIDLYKFFFIR